MGYEPKKVNDLAYCIAARMRKAKLRQIYERVKLSLLEHGENITLETLNKELEMELVKTQPDGYANMPGTKEKI